MKKRSIRIWLSKGWYYAVYSVSLLLVPLFTSCSSSRSSARNSESKGEAVADNKTDSITVNFDYLDISNTGIWRAALKEGRNGFGGGLSAGYTFMLSKHFNLELGVGGWAGVFKEYGFYSSPKKNFVREEGRKKFIYPDQVSLSFVYVF